MAKKKKARKMPIWKKVLRAINGFASGFLISSPVTIPLIKGGERGFRDKSLQNGLTTFIFEASGYDLSSGAVNVAKTTEVLVRDIVLVGIGMGLRWAGKRV